MKKRQLIILLISIGLLLGSALGIYSIFSSFKEEKKPRTSKVLPRKVISSIVKYSDKKASIKADGRVLSGNKVELISEVQGKILKGEIELREGESFKKGDVIAKIYNKDLTYALQSKKSVFLSQMANILPDIKIDYAKEYDKWLNFFEEISIDNPLPNLPEISTMQEKIFLSGRQVLNQYYAIKADEIKLEKFIIHAPFNGAITEAYFEEGSVANPGSRIAQIIKTGNLEIEVPIPLSTAKWVEIGNKAIIMNEDNDTIGKGWLARKSSYIDPNTQTTKIFVKITHAEKNIYSGQYVSVSFTDVLIENVMEIPRNAVFNHNQIFKVQENGFLEKREIHIVKQDNETLFFNGPEEGTEIITQPLANATENTKVETEYTKITDQ